MGTAIAVGGVVALALAITLLRGPWQGACAVIGSLLMAFGLWVQRRKSVDWSSASTSDDERLKDHLPGNIGGDPRPWLESHSEDHSDDGGGHG